MKAGWRFAAYLFTTALLIFSSDAHAAGPRRYSLTDIPTASPARFVVGAHVVGFQNAADLQIGGGASIAGLFDPLELAFEYRGAKLEGTNYFVHLAMLAGYWHAPNVDDAPLLRAIHPVLGLGAGIGEAKVDASDAFAFIEARIGLILRIASRLSLELIAGYRLSALTADDTESAELDRGFSISLGVEASFGVPE